MSIEEMRLEKAAALAMAEYFTMDELYEMEVVTRELSEKINDFFVVAYSKAIVKSES